MDSSNIVNVLESEGVECLLSGERKVVSTCLFIFASWVYKLFPFQGIFILVAEVLAVTEALHCLEMEGFNVIAEFSNLVMITKTDSCF